MTRGGKRVVGRPIKSDCLQMVGIRLPKAISIRVKNEKEGASVFIRKLVEKHYQQLDHK